MKRKLLLICGLVGLTLSPWAISNASAQRPQRGEGNADRERGGGERGGGERGGGERGGGERGGGERGRGGGPGGPGGMSGRGGGPGGGGGDTEFTLLRSPEIRAELELMPDQEEALKALEKRGQERPQGDDAGFDPRKFDFRNASEEDRAEMFKKIQAMRKEQAGKMREQLEEVLFPEQMERLSQLGLQLKGIAALADPDVQKKIGITEAKVEELKQFRADQDSKMRETMREVWESGDREGIREKMKEMRDKAEAEVMQQLAPEQREKLEEMKGEPFDFSKIQRPEGGRGGRGGGDRGAGGRGGPGGQRGAGGGGRGPGGDRGAGGRGGEGGGGRPSGGRPSGLDSDAQD